MKADVKTLNELTGNEVRYLVPRYQRPYVWTEEKHWGPLWGDLETAIDRLEEGEQRDHFLGAIVLKGRVPVPGEPNVFDVIDGQQRLTTTQIILAAAANVAEESGVERTGRLLRKMVLNDPDVAEGDKRFKLWPTAQDRAAFRIVAAPGGPPADAEDDPDNTIQEAYDFFHQKISSFANGDGSDPDGTLERLERLRSALSGVLKFVAIVLEGDDEAQVIFETLNARGTPLLALDLVKNAIFQAAGLDKPSVEALHDQVWDPELGLDYWREEVRQGRLTRPRAELFLIHWMTMKLGLRGAITEPIRSDRVFQTFSAEILKDRDGSGPEDLIRELARDARTMRLLDDVDPGTPEGRFFRTMDFLDTSVFYPVVLFLYTSPKITAEDRRDTLAVLESVQIRRSLMGLTGKGYNQIAIALLGRIGETRSDVAEVVDRYFRESRVVRSRWPTDAEVRDRLERRPIYGLVSRGKLAGILAEIERDLRRDPLTELGTMDGRPLSIEHVMPQSWEKHWALPDASPEEIEARNELVQTIGNLTLITGRLNSSLSNQTWQLKRERLRKHGLLLLNREILDQEDWTDDQIRARGETLADRVIALWPGPVAKTTRETARLPELDLVHEGTSFETDALERLLESASARFRELVSDLASHDGERRTFTEVEIALGWTPGSIPALLADFTRLHPEPGSRPFSTGRDRDGSWWIWMT